MIGFAGHVMAKNPVGRPTKYKSSYCNDVIAFMAEGYSLTAFAGQMGVSRSTINVWMAENPEFSEAVSRGKASRLLHWETSAMRVAKNGGGPGTATIIVFGLKNMGGDEWTDKQQLEHTGKDGGAIEVNDVSARERIAGRIAGLAARSGAGEHSGEPE